MEADQDVADPARLKLEDAVGLPSLEELEGCRVVVGNLVQAEIRVGLVNQFEGAGQNRQVLEAQEVHLQEPQGLNRPLSKLSHQQTLAAVLEGHDLMERLFGEHHPGRVSRVVPGQPLQLLGHFHQELGIRVVIDEVAQPLGIALGTGQGQVMAGWQGTQQLVDIVAWPVEDPADVTEDLLGPQGAEGNNLADVLVTVLIVDVLEDLPPPVVRDIQVDVRHLGPLGIEEALEEEVVGQGIHLGDRQGVGDQRPSRRTPAGIGRDLLAVGKVHDIPDDQEVVIKAHLMDHLELMVKAGLVILFRKAGGHRPLGQAPFTEGPQEGLGTLLAGGGKVRQDRRLELEFYITLGGQPISFSGRLPQPDCLIGRQLLVGRSQVVTAPFASLVGHVGQLTPSPDGLQHFGGKLVGWIQVFHRPTSHQGEGLAGGQFLQGGPVNRIQIRVNPDQESIGVGQFVQTC